MLEWLFDNRPAVPSLQSGVVRHVVEDFIAEQVTKRMYDNLHMRRNKKRVEQPPAALIALFNAAVHHLATVMSSHSLPELSWPPAELADTPAGGRLPPADWNRPARLLLLRESVERLTLPCLVLDEDADWAASCAEVLHYVGGVCEPGQDCTPLLYRVQSLLQERLRELEEAAWPLHEDIASRPLAASLPWTDIIQCCIELRTALLTGSEKAYFLPDEMAHFRVPDAWAEATSAGQTQVSLSLDASIGIAKRPLEEFLNDSVSKRRPEKSSSPRPSLDVSTDIKTEMDMSLGWEERLRELVDQGSRCSGGLPPVPAVAAEQV
ncbi:germinal-center associated nuclear protein-like [Pollicipes pollicipes]|uniref:germinal-center associated nuclear protein-like n=1 Tax=Pollicipes pollicipes TaxID=41117 RepID=UPI00188591C9|nr:germinal-center associated nuclear protein-like [Pollicipes pollicipes]